MCLKEELNLWPPDYFHAVRHCISATIIKWECTSASNHCFVASQIFLTMKWTRWPQSLRKWKHKKKIDRFEEYFELDVLKVVGVNNDQKVSVCGLWWHLRLLQQDICSVFIFVTVCYAISSILFNYALSCWVYMASMPILVALRSKALVCGRSLAGIAGSNSAGFMNACFLWIFCVVR